MRPETQRIAAALAATALSLAGAATTAAALEQGEPEEVADLRAEVAGQVSATGGDTTWRHLRTAATDGTECDAGTPLWRWLDARVAQVRPETLAVLDTYGALDWPYFWTLGGDQDASDEYIGLDGEYTREQERRHRDNQRFWAVPTDDVLLQGMHGDVIADDAKMVPVVQFVGGVDAATAQQVVDQVQAAVEADPALGYDHPLFTFNAHAWSGEIPGLGPVPDKIILGDGILQAFEEIGLGDVAPDMAVAHEFGHQVQFELGVYDLPEWSPEQNRRVELMADAFGAYHLAHARGATYRADRLVDTVTSLYQIGSCDLDSLHHHGTPEQRAAAASWGIAMATEPVPSSTIIAPADLVTAFDEALPGLLGG